jgi:predicted ATPase
VQSILAARIDRLAPEEKALLQQLAVIGREFPLSLICQVITQPGDDLYRLLSALQGKEFLYEQPAFPEVEYTFKHALTQEVAYGSVLQERRKVLHERTAQALEALYSTTLDDHYSDLAHHYSRSGNTPKAVEYLCLAGQQAVQRSANAEALGHLTSALELLKTLPDTPKRARQELTLQFASGMVLSTARGFAAPEAGRAYARARAEKQGEKGVLKQVLVFVAKAHDTIADEDQAFVGNSHLMGGAAEVFQHLHQVVRRRRPTGCVTTAIQADKHSLIARSMKSVSAAFMPKPAKCPQTDGMTFSTALGMHSTSAALSSGGK